ncbi:ABC transporter ATP-binding protein [Halolamina sp.]|jgi:multiple sugar transport system ATP-binding protein|uniref:ABC transporter ATP-binding protein n=1 Tax=Halolamina sp. TaxID=1940283 RepID=UPI003569323B
MASLTITGLQKEFDSGRIIAVDEFDLDVADGEFVTVVGPSGCGKTTLLRMIAGLEMPTCGNITLGNEDITKQNAQSRDVAMVFQNYALYPHKTVHQNMGFGLRMSTDLSKAERDKKIRETAEMMGIEELLEQKPDELSGGQKQRVALGRAIVREPELFLFDEPLSNLDAKLRTTMRAEIQRLQNELDITAIYVTHDQEEAMTMGDRIVVLRDGSLQQAGHPTKVYEHPINRFVAGFIGSPSMNFVEVELTETGALVTTSGMEYQLSQDYRDELAIEPGRSLVMGIRPEDVFPANGAQKAITTTVDVVEPIGSDNYLYLAISEEFIARVNADVAPNPGDTISVTFDEQKLRLFDGQSGESIANGDRTLSTQEAQL